MWVNIKSLHSGFKKKNTFLSFETLKGIEYLPLETPKKFIKFGTAQWPAIINIHIYEQRVYLIENKYFKIYFINPWATPGTSPKMVIYYQGG